MERSKYLAQIYESVRRLNVNCYFSVVILVIILSFFLFLFSLFLSIFLSCHPVRYFEVVSSNRKNSVFLRAKDPAMAQSWYNAIQAGIANLLPRVKEDMKAMQPGLEVKHLGWITEQVQSIRYNLKGTVRP